MAVIRNLSNDSHYAYLPNIALFCGIMCTIAMLKFGGFKASFNLLTGKKKCRDRYDKTSDIPVLGAYRSNREEYFGNANLNNNTRKLTASMARLPQATPPKEGIRPSKSTGDLLKSEEKPRKSKKSNSDIPSSAPVTNHLKDLKTTDKEQRKNEKEKTLEQKKREKYSEQQKLKKVNNNNNLRNETIQVGKPKSEKKKHAPKPPINQLPQTPITYSSNTLESSISRSSGPPPYSVDAVPNEGDSSGNTSFGKPVHETSSWDLVSQHRRHLNRPAVTTNTKYKSTVLDLRYNADSIRKPLHIKDNSEA